MSKPPEILYHYTSIDAFKGIVDNEHLRMTHCNTLNDQTEVRFALDIISDFLEQSKYNTKQEKLKTILLELIPYYRKLPLFIASFSQHKNHLEQWRAYTPVGGVSIGFCFKELDAGYYYDIIPDGDEIRDGVIATDSEVLYKGKKLKSFHGFRPPMGVWQCRYVSEDDEFKSSETDQQQCIPTKSFIEESVLKWFDETNINYLDIDTPLYESTLAHQLFYSSININTLKLASTIKHAAYSGEQEWRWVNISPKEQNFSLNLDEKNRLYVKARIKPKNCVKEVWISPHGDTETIKRVLEFYKTKHNLSFDIHESRIPYRIQ